MFDRQQFPLERIGALILGCAMLENDIEIVLWQLSGWPEPGEEPSTDSMVISKRLKEFRRLAGALADQDWPTLRKNVDVFADAADNVLAYRNAVAHGYPVGTFGDDSPAISISNTMWHGEARRRPTQEAHLDAQVIEMVLEALYLLLRAIHAGRGQAQEAMRLPALLQSPGLSQAKSLSGEARHLTELMNHEKY